MSHEERALILQAGHGEGTVWFCHLGATALGKDGGLRIVVTCPRIHSGGPEFELHVFHHLMEREKKIGEGK